MTTDLLPVFIRENYEVYEWKHACAVLAGDFPDEWHDIITVLSAFRLKKPYITTAGGNRSLVSRAIDGAFYELGWREKSFDTRIIVDNAELDSPTHKILIFSVTWMRIS